MSTGLRFILLPAWAAVLALPLVADAAADEQKIIRLEQDVRELERIVRDQARQIDELRRQAGYASTSPTVRPGRDASRAESDTRWLSISNWERVRPGMSELEVIDALGPPSALRAGPNDSRVLLYALEIGTSGFLSGSVTLQDRKVVEVQEPVLK